MTFTGTGKVGTAHIQVTCPPCYKVFLDGQETSNFDVTGLGCDDGYVRSISLVIKGPSSGGGTIGGGGPRFAGSLGGIAGSFSLGGVSNGGSAGAISFSSATISSALFTPSALDYLNNVIITPPPGQGGAQPPPYETQLRPEVDEIRDAVTGSLRQVKVPDGLADIRTISATSYEVAFFPTSQVGGVNPSSLLHEFTGSPSRIWRFSSPSNDASVAEIKVTEIRGAVQIDRIFSYGSPTSTWRLVTAGAGAETRSEFVLPNGDRQIETFVTDVNETLISTVRDIFHAFPWGEEKIVSINDPGGANLTTTWTYFENSAETWNYGKVKWSIHPDGGFERYEYYKTPVGDYQTEPDENGQNFGRVFRIFRPWKDGGAEGGNAPSTATLANCQVTTFEYGSPNYYSAYFNTEVTRQTSTVLGIPVETNGTYLYTDTLSDWDSPLFYEFPEMLGMPVVVRDDGDGYYEPGRKSATLDTTEVVPDYLKGRIAYVQEADGRQKIHTYQMGYYDLGTGIFTPSTTGDHVQEIVTEAVYYDPYPYYPNTLEDYSGGVPGKSLRHVRIFSPGGSLLSEESLVKTDSGFDSLNLTRHTYTLGNLTSTETKTTGGDWRDTYSASWLNGLLASETDETGITTYYNVYDVEGRVTQETRLGVVTHRVYDAVGRMTSSSRSAGGLTLASSTTYDDAGRLETETSEDGLVTITTYPGPRITTRTTSDTATEVSETYLDGQAMSVTGTAVVARFYDYGTDDDGLWRKESVGSSTSPRYSQSWTNEHGSTWRTASSGPAGPIITTTGFDPITKDRPISRTVPGEATILYAYDAETGALTSEARDLNGSGEIEYDGTDSIEKSESSYVLDGNWYRQSISSRYETDNDASATVLSTTREQLTGLGAGVSSIVQSINPQGHVTSRTTVINRASRTVTTTTDVPDSGLNAVEIMIDGKLSSTTTPTVSQPTVYNVYDALERLTTVTSPRGVMTTTAYDPATGRVSSMTHAGKTTSYTYSPAGTPGAGQVATETLPDTNVIRTSYTLRGEVFRVWGGATYPLERTYDAYGQPQFLKTYRAGTGWAAATWPASPGTADTTEWKYYEATGLLHQKLDAAQKATTYTYHPDGKLETRQRARGTLTHYTWTDRGFPEFTTHSDGTPSVSTQYDRAGRPITLVDAAGTHTYDYSVPLKTTEAIVGGILGGTSRSATSDTYERPSAITVASGSSTHATAYQYFPTLPRLEKVTTGSESATYAYLPNSDAIQSLTFKTGTTTRLTTTRSYDSSDRLAGVTNAYGSSQLQTFGVSEFDGMDRRKKITREDNTRWNYGYNDKGEVLSGIREKTAAPNTPVPGWNHGYTFDEIGNRLTATTNGRTSGYTPNNLNQIISRTVPRAFDVIGKASATASVTVGGLPATRLDEYFYKDLPSGSGAVHVPYTVAATDGTGPTTRSGGKFLPATPEISGYDFDGNLTSDGRFIYIWDAENRLTGMQTLPTVPMPARCKLAFAYDAMGRRIRKTTWRGASGDTWQPQQDIRFLHEIGGWNIQAELTTDGKFLRTYTWGSDLSGSLAGAGGVGGLLFTKIVPDNSIHANGMDLNGNVTLLVSTATGQATATYDYGPFGEPLRESGEYAKLNPYRFSSKYTDDETGLMDYGLRYYISNLGRWASRDPIGEQGGPNTYGFAGNDAIEHHDVLGLYVDAAKIANTMRASGWDRAQKLMEHFMAAPASSLRSTTKTGLSDPFNSDIITMQWTLSAGKYYTPYNELKKPSSYIKAKPNILKQAKEQTGPSGGVFGYHYVLGGEADMRKVHQTQVQYSAVPGSFSLNQYDAALHGFNFYSIVAGCASKDSSGEVTDVSISNIGIYLRDSWDFQGHQYLGAWNFKTNDVNFVGGPGYTFVYNGDLRDYQKSTGKGGEFWIFSDIENYRLPTPMLFSK